jgi:hypothetical protein
MNHTADTDTWWIARNSENSVIYEGQIFAGQQVTTGLDVLEIFLTEELWQARLTELGYVKQPVSPEE